MNINPCACMYQECAEAGRCLALDNARDAYLPRPDRINLVDLIKRFAMAPPEVEVCGTQNTPTCQNRQLAQIRKLPK